jgi:hypothetical protein
MAKINQISLFAAAAIIAAASGIMFQGNSAEASGGPLSCHGPTAKKVLECCQQEMRELRPSWMIRTGKNCDVKKTYAVRCKATLASANYRCRLVLARRLKFGPGGDGGEATTQRETPTRSAGGPNNSPNAPK